MGCCIIINSDSEYALLLWGGGKEVSESGACHHYKHTILFLLLTFTPDVDISSCALTFLMPLDLNSY